MYTSCSPVYWTMNSAVTPASLPILMAFCERTLARLLLFFSGVLPRRGTLASDALLPALPGFSSSCKAIYWSVWFRIYEGCEAFSGTWLLVFKR